MKPWMPFMMIGMMILVMVGLMGMFSLMFGEGYPMRMMLPSSQNGVSGMWRVMAIPFMGLLIMVGLMFFFFRWMTGMKGPMAMKVRGRDTLHHQDELNQLTMMTFRVPDVNCAHCKMKIEQELGNLPGVDSVSVDLEAKQAVLKLVSPPTRTEIESRLTEIGYPPEIL
jgi:copper chaperone CopZ